MKFKKLRKLKIKWFNWKFIFERRKQKEEYLSYYDNMYLDLKNLALDG